MSQPYLTVASGVPLRRSLTALGFVCLGVACSNESGSTRSGDVGGSTGSLHSGGVASTAGGSSGAVIVNTGGATAVPTNASMGGTVVTLGGAMSTGGSRHGTGGSTTTSVGGNTSVAGGTGGTNTTIAASTGGGSIGGTAAASGGRGSIGGTVAASGGSAPTGGTTAGAGGLSTSTGGASTASGGSSSANDGKIRWMGRVMPIDATSAKFAWQGAGLIANVSGSTISVKLRTEGTDTVYFQPVIDHTALNRFKVDKGTDVTVTLGKDLSAGEHLVELYRETEGNYGVSTFLGFTAGTVTGAPASNGRLLEVVGDSISAGYGDLGSELHPGWVANPACTWTAQNSSWYATYAAVAGHALGAEVSTVAKSGWGMYRDNGNNTNNVLSKVYANALGMTDSTKWDFTPKASAVVINLGTNDWANNYQGSQDPGTGYETAYVQFIASVRTQYPDAWVFIVIGPMLSEPELSQVKTRLASVVTKVQASTNDTKITSFDFGSQNLGENGEIPSGCDWHPSVDEHKRMAGVLQEQLAAKLGW